MTRQEIKKSKRIVIKIGTSVLAAKDRALDAAWIKDFTRQVASLLKEGRQVILVSSGAIAAGMHLLGMKKRPKSLPEQQACAAIGQGYLMKTYEDCFIKYGYHTAQILLTWEDMRERRRYLNAENTMRTLLGKKVIPVINENDTVSVDEIKFGDNDKLSALVANLADAGTLIMLTDVEGLCIEGRARCVDTVLEIDDSLERAACGTDKEYSLGGMKSKLEACRIAMNSGVCCIVADGRKKNILSRILAGEDTGTFFVPRKNRLQARKRWIAYNTKPAGKIIVDDGAKEALLKKDKSLLACGIRSVEGKFEYGDTVVIAGSDGREFARGLCNYSAEDANKIKGMSTKDAEKVIEKGFYQEVVHRDNLVIL